VSGYAPRALKDSVRTRRLICASGWPRNFTVTRACMRRCLNLRNGIPCNCSPLRGVFFVANMVAPMDWITDTIAIGTYVEAHNRVVRVGAGIRSIICLDAAVRDPDEPNLDIDDYEVVDLADGPGNDPRTFDRAVRLVGAFSEQSPKLLVHCRAGRSRSAVVVAGYLMRNRHWSSGKAMAFIAAHRDIQLTPGIEELLQSFTQPS